MNQVSQRTLVQMMKILEEMDRAAQAPPFHMRPRGVYIVAGAAEAKFWSRLLYENDFPEWFVKRAENEYHFNWDRILRDLRSVDFFFLLKGLKYGRHPETVPSENNEGGKDPEAQGEGIIGRLAALLCARGSPDSSLRRSLELDGFEVDTHRLELVTLEGPVSEVEEEDRFTALVRVARFPSEAVILKHLADAVRLYSDSKDHPCLGESRSFLQALIDDISTETNGAGGRPVALPGGTVNRIDYLRDVGFLTPDENSAFRSAWGALCGGSHPGVTAREEARIGLVLALEFGQLLVLKFTDWKANGYKRFTQG